MSVHKAYDLLDGNVVSREATEAEVAVAIARAEPIRAKGEFAMRSCWNCNPAHSRFLEDKTDGFLFTCFDCGRWFLDGVDLSGDDEAGNENA